MCEIPMIILINKVDREGKDAFELPDEIEKKLGLQSYPLTFAVGMGYNPKKHNITSTKVRIFKLLTQKNYSSSSY